MTRLIGGLTVAILFVTQAGLTVKGGDVAGIQATASEIGKEFSEVALESVVRNSTEDTDSAEHEYKELAKNETLIEASDIPYRALGGHAGFGAEMAEHMLWGGASANQTRRTIRKLAATYGRVLADIFRGGRVSAASQQFMMDLEHFLWPRHLDPDEHRLVVKSAKGQFSALYKIFRR